MQITVEIKECSDCRYFSHSGAFTVGGSRPVCDHDNACEKRRTKQEFLKEYPRYVSDLKSQWRYHWYHRITTYDKGSDGIPNWCPLKHGSSY